MGARKVQVNVRGLSPLGLKTPVEGPQLGGRVTTLSAGYTGKLVSRPFSSQKLLLCLIHPPPAPYFFLLNPSSQISKETLNALSFCLWKDLLPHRLQRVWDLECRLPL